MSMSDRNSLPEPSMEEILASIRRILAEDAAGDGPPPRLRAAADVLDLTEAINDDGSLRHVVPLRATEPAPALANGRQEPSAPRQATGDHGHLVSDAVSEAMAASFARLADLPRGAGNGERSLEDTVHETLRPLLQAWLDEHLPGIVERLVQAEIARVVGDAGAR
jgi:cell pole-organizing protein PopZ